MRPVVNLIHFDPQPFIEALKTYRGVSDNKATQLADKLWRRGHYSPYEFAVFTFKIENISAVSLRHITRHRTFKFACTSNRYKKADWFDTKDGYKVRYLVPKNLLPDKIEDKVEDFIVKVQLDQELSNDEYAYLTPACYRYNLLVMADLRNLVNFWVQRLHPSAHFEIRDIAKQMFKLVVPLEVIKEIDLSIWIAMEWEKLKMAKADEDELREKFYQDLEWADRSENGD